MANEIQFKTIVKFSNGSLAGGMRVSVKEVFGSTKDFGTTDQNGEAGGALRKRTSLADQPSFTVSIEDNLAHSFKTLQIHWPLMNNVNVLLPPIFNNTFGPTPIKHILRRKNLSTDFSVGQQEQLAELVFGYIAGGLIERHMEQIDHMDNFFIDHRMYIYEIEKKLLRDNHSEFVPLPIWEPLYNIPPKWRLVQEMPGHPQLPPLAPYNALPLNARPEIPRKLTPSEICSSGLDSSRELAIEIGRTATSAPGSFHFNTHLALAGPFFQMHTAAASVLFWPLHALFVDIYDKWLTCVFPSHGPRTLVARNADGALEIFRLNPSYRLWHTTQRLQIVHRDELDRVEEPPNSPTFDHWTHWHKFGTTKTFDDIKLINDGAGRIILLGKDQDRRLHIMRQINGGWTQLADLQTEVVDFAATVDVNNRLEIIVTRPKVSRNGSGYVVSYISESGQGSNVFTSWNDIAPIGYYFKVEAISTATGTPHAFVSLRTGGPMMHFWKRPNNTWTPFVTSLGGEYFRKFKVIRNRDGRFEIFGLRDSDGGIYHRWVQSAAIPVDWASSSTWSDWEKLTDVSSYYDFSIAENSDGRLEIFAIDVQFRRVRHAWQLAPGSSWSDWRTIEVLGVMGNDLRHINASTDREGRLAVFVDDSMHFTCTATQTAANQGPWIGWTNI